MSVDLRSRVDPLRTVYMVGVEKVNFGVCALKAVTEQERRRGPRMRPRCDRLLAAICGQAESPTGDDRGWFRSPGNRYGLVTTTQPAHKRMHWLRPGWTEKIEKMRLARRRQVNHRTVRDSVIRWCATAITIPVYCRLFGFGEWVTCQNEGALPYSGKEQMLNSAGVVVGGTHR